MPSSDSSANQEQVTSSEAEKPKGVRREQPNDPFHGITLETVVTKLVEKFGWFELGQIITIKCFQKDPSIKSSLKFLRKTPWARKKVEALYLQTFS